MRLLFHVVSFLARPQLGHNNLPYLLGLHLPSFDFHVVSGILCVLCESYAFASSSFDEPKRGTQT